MFFLVIDKKFNVEKFIFCERLIPYCGIQVYYNTLREHYGEFDNYKLYFGVSNGMWKI